MVVKEIKDNRQVHFSDDNKYIRKVGTNQIFSVAIDVLNKDVEYEETDEEMPVPEKPADQKNESKNE